MGSAPAPRRLRSVGVALLVAALHLLGLGIWLASAGRPWASGPARSSTPIHVWLKELAASPAEPGKLASDRAPAGRSANRATSASPTIPSRAAADTATPALPDAAAPSSLGQDVTPAVPAPSRPSLNLTLPRAALAPLAAPSLAARTPFHGRLPATVERQLEAAAGETGPWIEERLDYDHVRYRRGSTCVNMERPAASRIDPANDALQRLPWLANVSRCP